MIYEEMKLHGLKPVVSYRQLLLLTNSNHALKVRGFKFSDNKKHHKHTVVTVKPTIN